jgi:hypothetical protein
MATAADIVEDVRWLHARLSRAGVLSLTDIAPGQVRHTARAAGDGCPDVGPIPFEKEPPMPAASEYVDLVKDLAAKGYGRNAISRELAISQGTVSAAAVLGGVSFDRQRTAAANTARKADWAQRRGDLAEQFLATAERLLAAVDPGNPREARELVLAGAICSDKHTALVERDTANSALVEAGRRLASWLPPAATTHYDED